jgi:hypothetical protein
MPPFRHPLSFLKEDMSTMVHTRRRKKDIIGSRSTFPPPGGELDDAATITTPVFKAKLDQLSSFRQLSQEERQQLLLDVKKQLGGDTDTPTTKKKSNSSSSNYDHSQLSTSGGNKTTTDDVDEDVSTMSSTDEDSQTQFTFDETQFGGDQTQLTQFTLDETQFTVNEDQTEFTINEDLTQFTTSNEDDDQETQFSSTDSQSLLSLIDNVFARKSHDDNNNNNNNERRRESGYYNRSRSHGGSVEVYDVEEHDPFGENCMLSMCDSFLSRLICDGKSSDTVDMAARERRKENHRSRAGSGSRKGSRERKHDTTDKHRRRVTVAYRESSFIMDESVIHSDDSNNGGTAVSDNSTTVQDQQSSLLSGWTEAMTTSPDKSSLLSGWNKTTTSPDKVDPSSGVAAALMSMKGNQQLVTDHKDLIDDSLGVVVNERRKKESYKINIRFVDSNNHVTTARVSSPTESIDDIISQTKQLSSGKISLREDSAPTLDGGKTSSSSVIVPKKPWKEYTDRTTGLKYYSNGVITTWDRPDDSCNVIVASPSMSVIKSQLKNEKKQLLLKNKKKQLQLDAMAATNNGRFKLIRDDRPDDSCNIIVASPSMSAIISQLKNEKKQLQLDSIAVATNNGRFKSIRERVGIKTFFKRK